MFQDKIESLLKPVVASLGYEWWGSEYLPKGKSALLRIYIDQQQGIKINDCEKVSREINAILDVENIIAGHYYLEVSSPGMPRPLFYPNQYSRFLGQNIELKLHQPLSGQRKFIGRILEADAEQIKIEIPSHKKDEAPVQMHFAFSNIMKASVLTE